METKSILIQIRSIYAQIRNFWLTIDNEEFREFKIMEYGNVRPEEIMDVKRLKYLRNLDLATKGYTNSNISKLIAHYQLKQQLLNIDLKVLHIGQIVIKEDMKPEPKIHLQHNKVSNGLIKREGEKPSTIIHLGYDQESKRFKMAFNQYDDILVWKPINKDKLVGKISQINPTNGNSLKFDHSFNHTDIERTFPDQWKNIAEKYNSIIKKIFDSNKYFINGLRELDEKVLLNHKNIGQNYIFPESHKGHKVLKLTDVNSDLLVFQSLFDNLSTTNTYYFTKNDLKNIYLEDNIEKIAFLKHNLVIGSKEGVLYVGQKQENNGNTIDWFGFENAMTDNIFKNKIKLYLANEIILKKNFFLEKGKLELKSSGGSFIYFKRHNITNEYHWASGSKNQPAPLKFKPIDLDCIHEIRLFFKPSLDRDAAFRIAVTTLREKHPNSPVARDLYHRL